MGDVDETAKRVDALACSIQDVHDVDYGAGREDGILIGFNPRVEQHMKRLGQESGPCDPWWAQWKGHHATGATCEMALLELEASIRGQVQKAIEEENQRIEKRREHVARMRALLPAGQSEGDPP